MSQDVGFESPSCARFQKEKELVLQLQDRLFCVMAVLDGRGGEELSLNKR